MSSSSTAAPSSNDKPAPTTYVSSKSLVPKDKLRKAIAPYYHKDETAVIHELLAAIKLDSDDKDRIAARARQLVERVRKARIGKGGIDAFMHEFELSSQEGVVLMCLAEALLRIPDAETADRLIKDKLSGGDWEAHLGQSDSILVNASTWALMLTGRVVSLGDFQGKSVKSILSRLVNRTGEPMIRQAVTQGMRIMGKQFVLGRTIDEAFKNAREKIKQGYTHSFDMLGEAARTAEDAERYFNAYATAIETIGKHTPGKGPTDGAGISIKLSALHPRYDLANQTRVMDEMLPKLVQLAQLAKQHNLGLTIDAEEAERLEPSMDIVEALCAHEDLQGWNGLGLAVQAYQKRALPFLKWLAALARKHERRLMVRLVKGAYWDTEVKRAQEEGLAGYPVFTRKASTDVSYLACAQYLLKHNDAFYSQFATHNAHTLAAIMQFAGNYRDFEFQCLHGMGEALYSQVVGRQNLDVPCRIYAPVGSHEDLLAYLVRRLLENGANSSFVNRIVDERAPIEEIIADPINAVERLENKPHPKIPLPIELFGDARINSIGAALADWQDLEPLKEKLRAQEAKTWLATSIIGGVEQAGAKEEVILDPTDQRRLIGKIETAHDSQIDETMQRAARAHLTWDRTSAGDRASCLERAADLFEEFNDELMYLLIREAGKSIPDAIAEIREAVDFCRYYAMRARLDFAGPSPLPGPTGELNEISLHGRGVFVCISPWNFPLAIFCGQISAALAAGNCVVAKPAEQTPLIAFRAIQLLHQAGVPEDVLQLLIGDGKTVGAPLVAHPLVAGVAFTGSTETAQGINRTLAARDGSIVPLIAETGGQNVMIVDSSALPEQVIDDVIASAFQSAGQRCSALRVLCLQDDIADKVIRMLKGAMAELSVGDPALLSTDLGPVIDMRAKQMLEKHIDRMQRDAKLIYKCDLPLAAQYGFFVPPAAFEIKNISQLEREVFGPVLHIVRYQAEQLDKLIDEINATGYGLTLGIHSRIDGTIRHIHQRLKVGNAYVNRTQIGAIVGVQPFGGEGLSGTGPKAGGPRYLYRFATERALSVNTTAQGGNTALMSLSEN